MKLVFPTSVMRGAALLAMLMVSVPAMGQKRPSPPAAGVRLWTCQVVSEEREASAATTPTLHPVLIVGARNGTYSGKVVVDAPNSVKGLNASVTAITGEGGVIPAQNVQVRYAVAWAEHDQWARPTGADILLETPPAQVDPLARNSRAYAPVWITVKIPKDAKPGNYTGTLTVQAQGLRATPVPIKLQVLDWVLPDPQDYRTWIDFIESPDTLAVEYKVPLWSDKHWDLIGRSFRLLSDTGSRVLYIPLICHTNFGNEQSMVRWIPKGGNQYNYDFSVMDKYLDSAQMNLGKPKLVIFLVWDICMSQQSLGRGLWGGVNPTEEARKELLGKGPRVTELDPATKEASVLTLPRYEDPASRPLWQPLFDQVRQDMAARGLSNTMMLGLMPDLWPDEQEAIFWKDISGGLPWAIEGHAGVRGDVTAGNKLLHKIADIGYAAYVYNLDFNCNVAKGRQYGWRDPELVSMYYRGGDLNMASLIDIREFPAFNITGGQRGGGRMGGDFWPVFKNKKGLREGSVYTRYPENNWRNLDISDWFLAPGPDGAIATARLEALKEGLEVCESRIFLESALLNPGQKARLGPDLAQNCQAALDDLHHAMWMTVWPEDADLAMVGKTDSEGRNPGEGLWNSLAKAGKKLPEFWSGRGMRDQEARKGRAWFAANGWQDKETKLYDLCAEAAAKLGPPLTAQQ